MAHLPSIFLWRRQEKQSNIKHQTLILRRYQIHVQNEDCTKTYLCDLFEAFSFKEACDQALTKLKLEMDISHVPTPLKFWSSWLEKEK